MRIRAAGIGLALAWMLPCLAVAAPTSSAEAKKRAYAGVEAYQAGNYEAASADLEPAFAVIRAPSVGLWSARALAKLGKWVEAIDRYRLVGELDAAAGDKKSVQDKARADAAKELAELLARTPVVRVKLENATPDEVKVTLDGTPIKAPALSSERLVNPGEHEIVGQKRSERVKTTVTAAESGSYVASLRFAAPAARDEAVKAPVESSPAKDEPVPAKSGGSPLRTVGFVSLGVGGAGLVLSGVSALLALGKKPDSCVDNKCAASDGAAVDSYGTWRTVSTVSFWSGAALASVGAVLVFAAPSGESGASGPSVALRLTPARAELQGTF